MTGLMHYLHGGAHPTSLLDRIWHRIRTAISGPAYDLACTTA